jgi:hypothetical protein
MSYNIYKAIKNDTTLMAITRQLVFEYTWCVPSFILKVDGTIETVWDEDFKQRTDELKKQYRERIEELSRKR